MVQKWFRKYVKCFKNKGIIKCHLKKFFSQLNICTMKQKIGYILSFTWFINITMTTVVENHFSVLNFWRFTGQMTYKLVFKNCLISPPFKRNLSIIMFTQKGYSTTIVMLINKLIFRFTMEGIGLPKLGLIKHWTLLGLNCYLFLSLNFVGIFAQDSPHRLSDHQHSRVSPVH